MSKTEKKTPNVGRQVIVWPDGPVDCGYYFPGFPGLHRGDREVDPAELGLTPGGACRLIDKLNLPLRVVTPAPAAEPTGELDG